MKGLTVCQPWADAIAFLGKRVENRTWLTRYRGPLILQAGKSLSHMTPEALAFIRAATGRPFVGRVFLGSALAIVRVRGAFTLSGFRQNGLDKAFGVEKWLEGPNALWFGEPLVLRTPVPMRGAQGLFDVPADIVAAVALAVDPPRANGVECRWCGCTEKEACWDPRTGVGCHWVSKGVCSACAEFERAVEQA